MPVSCSSLLQLVRGFLAICLKIVLCFVVDVVVVVFAVVFLVLIIAVITLAISADKHQPLLLCG